MRLTCPDCATRYEIGPDLIPAEGRDVQCSTCGHIWVQYPDGRTATAAPASRQDAPTAAGDGDAPAAHAAPGGDVDPGHGPAGTPVAGAGGTAPIRPELNEATRRILREEAEREAALRAARLGGDRTAGGATPSAAAPGAPSTSQTPATPDKPRSRLSDGPDAAAALGAIAHVPEGRDPGETDPSTGSGGVILGPDPGPARSDGDASRSGGFGTGFLLVVLLCAVLTGLYLAAPALARSVPELEPPLAAYVDAVNAVRDRVVELGTSLKGSLG